MLCCSRKRLQPNTTRTDNLFPSTTLCRSARAQPSASNSSASRYSRPLLQEAKNFMGFAFRMLRVGAIFARISQEHRRHRGERASASQPCQQRGARFRRRLHVAGQPMRILHPQQPAPPPPPPAAHPPRVAPPILPPLDERNP